MEDPYNKQAKTYVDARPRYPKEWLAKLPSLTPHHALAWDAGTGNGQAAIATAEHYARVIATDVSEGQLNHAIPHPKVQYLHTPVSLSEDEIVVMLGGENSVDLITVATAIHWFDIPNFYSIVKRVLRKPGGVIAVWTYTDIIGVNPEVEELLRHLRKSYTQYRKPGGEYILEEYRNLPFPFEIVGLGSEGEPAQLDMPIEMSFQRFLSILSTYSTVAAAKENGVELLTEEAVKVFETAWGGSDLVRTCELQGFHARRNRESLDDLLFPVIWRSAHRRSRHNNACQVVNNFHNLLRTMARFVNSSELSGH